MTLVDECILALGKDAKMLGNGDIKYVLKKFYENVKLTAWGAFDCSNTRGKKEKCSITELNRYLNLKKYYIIWDNAKTPILLCSTDAILNNIYDITAVGTNTWLVSEYFKRFIEIYHEYELNVVTL